MKNNFTDLLLSSGMTSDELQKQLEIIKEKENQNKWIKDLDRDSRGNILTSPQNYMCFFDNAPGISGKLKYNLIKRKYMIGDKEFSDGLNATLFNQAYDFFKTSNKTNFDSAVKQYFNEHSYNPVINYLKSLKWDKENRLETVFIDWLGAEDSKLNREMTKKWLLAAVKRILIPGCSFDNIIVLYCPEGGGGKTTLVKRLGLNFGNGEDNYYNELTGNDILDTKRAVEKMNEAWIMSFDELDGLNKKDVNIIKTFLSGTEEKIRLSYDRFVSTHKRHCVFIGSTNENTFLKDYSSETERRFWVIPITRTYKDNIVWNGFTKDVVDQIWAEAYYLLQKDINQSLDLDISLYADMSEKQKEFKSYNNDVDLDFYRDLFNHDFVLNEEGSISNYQIFEQQLNGNYPTNTNAITCKLLTIPCSWVKQYMQTKHIDWKGPKYIAAACNMLYKNAKFNNKVFKCFVSPYKKDGRSYKQSDLITVTGKNLFN